MRQLITGEGNTRRHLEGSEDDTVELLTYFYYLMWRRGAECVYKPVQ